MAASRSASATTSSATNTGSRRVSFARIQEPLEVPDLLALQTESLTGCSATRGGRPGSAKHWTPSRKDVAEQSGLEEIFEEISPIEDFSGTMSLSFRDHRFEPPKYSAEECKDKDMTYSAPMFVTAEFINNTTGEIKSQTVFMGDFPLMSGQGHLHHQRHRARRGQPAGPFTGRLLRPSGRQDQRQGHLLLQGDPEPRVPGSEFEIDKRDAVGVRIDRKRKQSVTVLLKALGWDDAKILDRFGGYESMRATLEKDHTA